MSNFTAISTSPLEANKKYVGQCPFCMVHVGIKDERIVSPHGNYLDTAKIYKEQCPGSGHPHFGLNQVATKKFKARAEVLMADYEARGKSETLMAQMVSRQLALWTDALN